MGKLYGYVDVITRNVNECVYHGSMFYRYCYETMETAFPGAELDWKRAFL